MVSYRASFFNPTTEEEILDIIKRLNTNSSNGRDEISTKFIQKYKQNLAIPLSRLLNKTFNKGTFPECLKMGAVVPIHKEGSKLSCSNYRPITKLSVIDKILEQAILTRLQKHLEKNNIIDRRQFGYVKNSNTLAACIECTEFIYEQTDKNKYVALLSIDLKKAFDSAHIGTLIAKLQNINIAGKEIDLLSSFLTNRRQVVEINGVKSSAQYNRFGVPQGSKLAATLFIILINGIFDLNLKSSPQFYADDGLFKFSANNPEELVEWIEHDLSLIHDWLESHKLKLNLAKTKILLVDKHRDNLSHHFIGINFKCQLIKREKSIKYLGLTIDEKINWSQHIEQIKNRLGALAFAMYRMKNTIPSKQLWNIYHAHFMSHINYLNPIWNKCAAYHMNEIQRTQNKILKTILKLPRLTATRSLYRNRLNVQENSEIHTITLIQNIRNKQIKFNRTLNPVTMGTRALLRNMFNLRTTFLRKERSKRSITSYGIDIYNKIPNHLKEELNSTKFKKGLKTHYLNCKEI